MSTKENFKFNLGNLEEQIFNLANDGEKLSSNDLEKISGGKLDNKFLSGSLASLMMLTGTGLNSNVHAEKAPSQNYTLSVNQNTQTDEIKYFTKEQVIEDINYTLDTIKSFHMACKNGLPKEVEEQRDLEIKNLSESTSTIDEWRIISRILATFNDAHTIILAPKFINCNRKLPFDIRLEGDKIYCSSGEFKGAEIVEINEMKISDIYENFKLGFSYEIEEWAHANFFRTISNDFSSIQANLERAGIDTLKPMEFTFKTENGIVKKSFELTEPKKYSRSENVSYKIDKENKVGIITINRCCCDDNYVKTVDDFFADVEANKVENIVIDLRQNQGGHSRVINYFSCYLGNIKDLNFGKIENKEKTIHTHYTENQIKKDRMDKNVFNGKIFVLSSNFTFSSGMRFVSVLSDNKLATVVGEVPGNSPTIYGDIGGHIFNTPNSNLRFCATYKKFYRPDESKDLERLTPDVQVPAEEALNKTYELIKSN